MIGNLAVNSSAKSTCTSIPSLKEMRRKLRKFESSDQEIYNIDIELATDVNQKWYCQKPAVEPECLVFLYCWNHSHRHVIIKQSTVCETGTGTTSFQKFNTTTTKVQFLLRSDSVMSLCFRRLG